MIFHEIKRELFECCETEARSLLLSLAAGKEIDSVATMTLNLGTCLEYALCDLFEQHENTRGYWVDGVVASSADLPSSQKISLQGFAWCAEGGRDQWKVPIQVELSFSNKESSHLVRLRIRIGDSKIGSLGNHRTWKEWPQEPKHWLLDFQVIRP